MGRWDPDAEGRLKQAALSLYLERGYANVTVTEIAVSVGLTKRTFFRYFTDKRDVLFGGAQAFEAGVAAVVSSADESVPPIDAAVAGLVAGCDQLAPYRQFARERRDLIASSTDLQERELGKMATLTEAVAAALRERGTEPLQASLSAQAGVVAFATAYARWVDEDDVELPALIHHALQELRRALTVQQTSQVPHHAAATPGRRPPR